MLSDIPDGGVRTMSLGPEADTPPLLPFRILLLRSGGMVLAYVNRCAHFGVPLSDKPEHLIFDPYQTITCNVHYARYRWSDGVCISGDCEGESLIAVPVRVEPDGQVVIAG